MRKVPKARRVAPVATVSDTVAIDGTTATAITYSSSAISGCLVYGLSISSFDDIGDECKVQILSDSTSQAEVMLVHTANQPLQTHFAFPAPIWVDGALKLKHTVDSDIDWIVHYVPA